MEFLYNASSGATVPPECRMPCVDTEREAFRYGTDPNTNIYSIIHQMPDSVNRSICGGEKILMKKQSAWV
ncbi:MAG: hypothetical protein IJW90_02180 [Clostridia bacterium]|nr:hypothetical protein [Clostridia bacterium]